MINKIKKYLESESFAKLKARKRRLIVWGSVIFGIIFLVWLWFYLRPDTWRYYTDEISFAQLKKDVEPRLVVWDEPAPAESGINIPSDMAEASVSTDGKLMVFTRGLSKGNADLYVSRWDGSKWGEAEPIRALNSQFNEAGPSFSGDGKQLFFSTDRPGGRGGYDIWVARWDGSEFAWPLPMTLMVNTAFDEISPEPAPDDDTLYFSSNRPEKPLTEEESVMSVLELRQKYKNADYDLFEASRIPAGVTNREVERAMSMLYSLREGALSDQKVMKKLGGTSKSEKAVGRALEWLAKNQEGDGRWTINRGAQHGHDVAATSFALLTFFGRSELSGRDCKYRKQVEKGVEWLLGQQVKLTGDMRGKKHTSHAMYNHGIASLALAEGYGLTKDEDLYGPAQSAIDFIVDSQNPKDGGWRYKPNEPGDLSVSGWMIMALKSGELSGLHVPEHTFDGVRKWLKKVSGGKNGGLYGYQHSGGNKPAMVATGFFCSQLMGLSPNTLRAFETVGNLSKRGVSQDDIYYAYYGTLCSYQNQGDLWREWNKGIQNKFVRTQKGDGSWTANGNHTKQMGPVIITSLVALSLQAHYRYTPFYGLGYEPSKDRKNLSRMGLSELGEVPLYRRAKRLSDISSVDNDLHPSVTEHGDFMYFVSDRPGGEGGMDIYRTRISGKERSEPENIGRAINTDANETAPTLRMAGFNLLFSSNREKQGGKRHRIYSSVSRFVPKDDIHKDDDPRLVLWDDPLPLWGRFNVPTNKMGAAFMPDDAVLSILCDVSKTKEPDIVSSEWTGRIWGELDSKGMLKDAHEDKGIVFSRDGTMVYFSSAMKGGHGGYDIWSAARKGNKWGDIKNLGSGVNSEHNETAPALMPGGDKLFFASDITSDSSGVDIYMVDLSVAGSARKAERLDVVCSGMDDTGPAVSPQGDLFYFASDRDGRYGSKDLFVSRIVDGEVLAPENMGVELNGEFDDDLPALRMRGFDMVFSSNRDQKDIKNYQLFVSTVREVVGRVDYSRWYAFKNLVNKIKWWVLLLIAMIAAMIYLLRHIDDLSSLFHKCLMISILVHVIALLIMCFWFITQEVMESSEVLTMEVTIDVNALAKEKLALDMQDKITELDPSEVSVAVEKAKELVPIPEFEPAKLEVEQPIVTETDAESFVAEVTPSKESDKQESEIDMVQEFEQLPEMEMMELDVVMEEADSKHEEVETEEFTPVVTQEDVVAEKTEQIDVTDAPSEPEEISSDVVSTVQEKVKLLEEMIEVSVAEEAKVDPSEIKMAKAAIPEFELPEMQVDVVLEEVQEQTEEVEPKEYEPSVVQEEVVAAKLEYDKPSAKPVNTLVEVVDAEGSSVTNKVMDEVTAADTGLITASEGIEPSVDILEISSAKALTAEFEVFDMAVDVVMEELEHSVDVGKQSAEKFEPSIVQEDVVVERSQREGSVTSPADTPVKVTDIENDSVPEETAAAATGLIEASVSREARTDVSAVRSVKTSTVEFSVPDIDIDMVMDEMASIVAVKSGGRAAAKFSPVIVQEQVTAKRGEYKGVVANTVSTKAPEVSSDIVGEAVEAPTKRGSGLVGATASVEVMRHSSRLSSVKTAVSEYMVPNMEVDVVMTDAAPSVRAGRVTVAEAFRPTVVQERMAVKRSKFRRSNVKLTGGPGKRVAASKDAVVSSVTPGVKVSDSGGELIVASAGLEALGRLPVMHGSGSRVSLFIKSDAMGREMKIDAPGKLAVPSSAGESISPVIFKNPGKLSDEVVKGLGGSALTQGTIIEALDWFTKNQEPDGHWDIEKHGGSKGHDIGGTSLILLCYYGWGAKHNEEGPYQETVKKAIDWLVSQMKFGGDLHHGRNQAMYDQGIATIVLCEAYGVTKDKALYEPAKKAITFISRAQNLDSGGWRYKPGDLTSDTSVLGWQYMALKSAELAGIPVQRDVLARAHRWLDRIGGGKHGGLYGYQERGKDQPAMIATGMFCRQLAKVPPSDPRMREGALFMKGKPLTVQDIDFYYLYYGTLALYQHQGMIWEKWNERMKEIMPELQQKTGPHAGTWNPHGPHSHAMGRAVVTAFGTLSLEVYYRILPIYGFRAEGKE